MKNILIIAGTYYPDSMATIGITQRLAEALVEENYNIQVYSVRFGGHKNPGYPKFHNGVEIFDTDDFKVNMSPLFKLKWEMNNICRKVLKHLKKKSKNVSWIKNLHRKIYKTPHKQLLAEIEACKIEQLVEEKNIDTVISVALPFFIQTCANRLKKINPKINWIPVSFDPYAYDEVTNADRKEECIKEEIKVLKNADKILLLTQFKDNYKDSVLREKIDFFELPNIREMKHNLQSNRIDYDSEKINCVFLGNLYLIQRHPQFLFELFEGMKNKNIVLYIIGSLVDLPKEYIDEWSEKFNGRLIYTGRVSQKAAINAMLDADILINIGHSTTNQCPSKILDYMSTGKPILSIAKIDNCTSEPYLSKYPNVLTLRESNTVTVEDIQKAEAFIEATVKKEAIKFEVVEQIFKDSTMQCMIEKIENV